MRCRINGAIVILRSSRSAAYSCAARDFEAVKRGRLTSYASGHPASLGPAVLSTSLVLAVRSADASLALPFLVETPAGRVSPPRRSSVRPCYSGHSLCSLICALESPAWAAVCLGPSGWLPSVPRASPSPLRSSWGGRLAIYTSSSPRRSCSVESLSSDGLRSYTAARGACRPFRGNASLTLAHGHPPRARPPFQRMMQRGRAKLSPPPSANQMNAPARGRGAAYAALQEPPGPCGMVAEVDKNDPLRLHRQTLRRRVRALATTAW
eukprot:scaffold7436_cov258-Pinguiococcus_pyrenoidosus.AAC.6